MNKKDKKKKKVGYRKIEWDKLSTEEALKMMETLQVDLGKTDAVKLVHENR